MNSQYKLNAVKSRIAQIETSDLFSPEEKERLLKINNQELDILTASITNSQ